MAAATETGGETKAGLKVALQNRPASPPVIPDLKKRPMQNLRDRPPSEPPEAKKGAGINTGLKSCFNALLVLQ